MAKDSIATLAGQRSVNDIANDIDCTISILRDLLKLALQECPTNIESGCKTDSAIRAANRYVDDIAHLNQGLFKLHFAEKGGA